MPTCLFNILLELSSSWECFDNKPEMSISKRNLTTKNKTNWLETCVKTIPPYIFCVSLLQSYGDVFKALSSDEIPVPHNAAQLRVDLEGFTEHSGSKVTNLIPTKTKQQVPITLTRMWLDLDIFYRSVLKRIGHKFWNTYIPSPNIFNDKLEEENH